jgi:protein-S-isoprenylcysteine O-methyltransferase Ste14
LVWFLAFSALNQTYIPLWEEPDLQRRFGADYVRYKRNVRRWLP